MDDGSFAYAEARPYAPPTTHATAIQYAPPTTNAGFGEFTPIASNPYCTAVVSGSAPNGYAPTGASIIERGNTYARAELYSGGVACATASSRPVSRANSPVAAQVPTYYPRPPSPSQRKHVFDVSFNETS